MKTLFTTFVILCTMLTHLHANNPIRKVPYPQQEHVIYLNPAPLLVPPAMKQSDFLQFNLSPNKDFKGNNNILSKPVPWCVFNPHQTLSSGTWYWRFRSISKSGEEMPWSETYSFTVTDDTPRFATPPFSVFMENAPKEYPRIFCFLKDNMEQARKQVRSHPEFEAMIDEGRNALSIDYSNDTKPYNQITLMAADCDKLNTAYQMLQRDLYADKMVKNVRCLLSTEPDPKVIANDFNAGELVYTLACTYDNCPDRFTPEERKQIETIIMNTLTQYYTSRILGREENMFFDEHFWQFTFRHFLQGALVLYDKYPLAKEYMEYSYELWTSRAPASGFNRSGAWHNGTNYFSANAISLAYTATLFSHLTGVDFMQHPWYKNAGLAIAYSWQPGSLSNGFGDGHENTNSKPLRIRSAFADFMSRNTGDPYATWYSSINDRYKNEFETRLYRMASGKQRPAQASLPTDAPKAVWFKDCGEMIANSDLNDLKRNISLSFHSSPFGSGNHTHSNQNAFNLHYGGEAVYRAVGNYMKFDDPHNLLSYRNTRAYNTLLIDGIGQPFTQLANGYITRMFNGDHLSYALGDASNAYCGISEINYWVRAFAENKLEQSAENGFGATPLKKYRRHIFLLHPNTVVIYDELEAEKAVRWDWLLHSPVKFEIDEATATLVTVNKEKQFASVARLFSEQPCNLSQTDQYAAAPNRKNAERGEDFTNPWSLTASFGPSKANRILTIIQLEADGKQAADITRKDNQLQCGDWTIEAELNAKRPASLYIHHNKNKATFSYGKKGPIINGQSYSCKKADASVLYDAINGEWKTQEMSDQCIQTMGKW
ncbi:DUF4962 domain-containing protein [Bacteroides sp.]|uniref:DUF4962 domain-containing protein n=1 Tax=Bacteroides sp. TaxID=29523 RepID=UPI002609128F|nr:DUF4962 domain-containing protein [Bacteroides sp.]